MPVFDQGYRAYEGTRVRRRFRWWPITRTCFRTALGKGFVVIIAASFPFLFRVLQVYASGAAEEFGHFPKLVTIDDRIFFSLLSDEIFFVVLLLAVTGSGQIAGDLRTGALQIYFSKPIHQRDYVLGKLGSVVLTALLLTLLPGFALLLCCASFAPDWTFITENPLLPLKVAGFSVVISLVLGTVVLALSSVGRHPRSVGLLFVGGYFFTMALSRVLSRVFADPAWEVVHLGNCLDAAASIFFERGPAVHAAPELAWGVLGTLTLMALLLLCRRVDAVEVVS